MIFKLNLKTMKRIFLMFILFGTAHCFAQNQSNCLNAPISLTNTTKEVTVDGNTSATLEKQYVYYHRKRGHKRPLAQEFSDIPDPKSSNPVLLSKTKTTKALPESYKFTVNTPQDHAIVCPDSLLSLPANINMEKVSEYTGYYPAGAKKSYKEVSRRVYMKTARKMRKAERKESRVASLAGVPVEVPEKG